MASDGREQSRNRRRAENRKKIDDQTNMAEELQKEVEQGSQQFKELLAKARDLRRVFEELDKEHADRERTEVPGHVKNNVEWDQKRNRLHKIYHSIKSYLDQNAPEEEGVKLDAFEPRRLKTTEPSNM
jgi:septal ring factor EnvC (AmiA/AmiB activator)